MISRLVSGSVGARPNERWSFADPLASSAGPPEFILTLVATLVAQLQGLALGSFASARSKITCIGKSWVGYGVKYSRPHTNFPFGALSWSLRLSALAG